MGGDYQSGYTENGRGVAFTALDSGRLRVSFDVWMDNSMTTGDSDMGETLWESFNFLELNGEAESHAIDVGSNQSYESGLVLSHLSAEGSFAAGETSNWSFISILQGHTVSYVPAPAPVPEPATMLLLGTGLVGLLGLGRKKLLKK